MGSSATKKGSVALGAGSTTLTDATYQDKLTIGSKDYLYAGATNDKGAQVSVGSKGRERQIKHVASGEVSSGSTDAVNGSQLHATNESVKDLSTTVVANKTHYYSVKDGGTPKANYNNDGAIGNNAMAAGIGAEAKGDQATAVGYKAKAVASESTAIGREALAEGHRSVALGYAAKAKGHQSVAIGDNAETQARSAVAIGLGAKAFNGSSTAIGNGADTKTATDAIALGTNANVENRHGIAMGIGATSVGDSALAIGSGSQANGLYTVAMGKDAQALHREAVAIGKGAIAKNGIAVSIGSENTASGDGAVAIGDPNVATGAGAVAIGKDNTATGIGAIALGNESLATKDSNIALGNKAQATGNQSIAQGSHAKALGDRSVALGERAQATTLTGTAIGSRTLASAVQSTAVGVGSKATKQWATATGFSSEANGISSVALGDRSVVDGKESIAIGKGNTVNGTNSIAVGTGHTIAGNNSGAFGDPNIISGSGSYAVGNNNNIANNNTFVLGNNVGTTQDNSVVLGSLSTDRAATTETGVTINGKNYTYVGQGSATNGVMSVGFVGGERQIINVAAGAVSASSTDAINGSQLHATNEAIDDLSGTVIANKTKYYSVNSDATGNKNNDGAQGPNSMAMGGNASATGGQAIAIGSGESGQNTVASGQQSIAIGANVVSSGNSSIAIGGDDLDAASKVNGVNALFDTYTGSTGGLVTVGDYSNHTESNGAASVAIGVKAQSSGNLSTAVGVRSSSSGDASSAFGMGSSATKKGSVALGAGSVANRAGGLAGYIPTGVSLADADAITNTQSGAISGAVSVGSGAKGGNRQIINLAAGTNDSDAVNVAQLKGGISSVIDLGLDFTGDTGTATRKLGQTLSITGGATSDLTTANIGVEADETGGLVVKLAEKVNLGADGSVTTGNTLVNNDGLTIAGGPSFTTSGIDAGDQQIKGVLSGGLLTDVNNELNAANIGDIKTAIGDVTTLGFGIKAADNNEVQKNLGQTVDIIGSNSNLTTQIDNGKVEVVLNNNLDLDTNGSVKMGSSSSLPYNLGPVTTVNSLGVLTGNWLGSTAVTGAGIIVNGPLGIPSTALTSDGLTILNGPSMTRSGGINAANKKIINVDNGEDPNDAVNVSQLNSASAAAKTEVAAGTNIAGVVKSTGGNGQDVYTVNADGVTASAGSAAVTVTAGEKDETTNTTDYAVDLSADSKASLVKADSAMQTIVAQIDGVDVKTLNQTDNTANFLTGDNIVLTAEDGGIKIATKEDVTFTSASFADSTVRVSSEGLDNGGNRIINVDDGQGDTDAVNVRQLNATNNTVDLGLNFTGDDTTVVVNRKLGQTLTLQGGATELTENNIGVIADEEGNLNVRLAEDVMLGKNGSVRMESTVLNNAGVTITDGPNQTITLSNEGLDNGNNRIIKVDKGIAPTDAVNFAQLTMTNDEIAKGIKIGDGNSANDQQFALGDTINVTGDNNLTTVASATGIQVKLNNQLDLGDDGSIQIGNSIMSDAGFTFVGNGVNRMVSQVSLSSRGLDNGGNTIRNVGEGVLNTDAVNVGQLKDVAIALDQGWGITAQGDIATMVKQGDAVDLSSKDGNIKVSRKSVSDVAALNGSPSLQAAAIPTNANDISFDLNPDITLNSVTTGDTVMNDNGLTIAGGPSITKSGIDAANTKITNVQNGEVSATSQDAINGGQLYAQGTGISSIIGGDTVYNAEDGTFTNSDIGGTGESNIDGAIASIRQGTIEISENVQINTESITTNTTNIATNTTNIATNTSNITTNTTNIETNTDKLNAGLNFGADSGANINKPIGDDSVLSFTGGNNITTTADGSSIKFDLNGNISVDSVTVGTTVINSEGISMQDGPSMTSQGLYAGNQRMTGVADGVEATDAVNYSQLSALDSRLNNNMSDLGYKIDEVEDDANAGISAAMAMSAMPQAYIAGKSLIGGGVGTYNGESAVAIGFSKLSNDGRWVIKVNGTADTQGNVGGAVGAGFHFD